LQVLPHLAYTSMLSTLYTVLFQYFYLDPAGIAPASLGCKPSVLLLYQGPTRGLPTPPNTYYTKIFIFFFMFLVLLGSAPRTFALSARRATTAPKDHSQKMGLQVLFKAQEPNLCLVDRCRPGDLRRIINLEVNLLQSSADSVYSI
jgi:hypothetical protein